MFEIAFSFQGQLKRLPYFLGSLVLGAAFAVGLCAIGIGFIYGVAKHNWALVALLCVALLPLGVAMLWCSLSLHVRRIRDIGWDPTIVIASWLFGNLADKLVLAHLVPAMARHMTWQQGTYLGALADFALSLAILFWPSRKDDDDVTAPPRQTWTAPPTRPASVPAAPRSARAGGRAVFGRR